jgi:alcohol dehydrogenase YqhD (iron-dependent ADH family)
MGIRGVGTSRGVDRRREELYDFELQLRTKYVLKKDAEVEVGAYVREISDKVLFVHYGDGFMRESGLYDRIVSSLKASGVSVFEQSGIMPNPVLAPVREGVRQCREQDIGCVLAVGGGSVVDTAKAIAVGVYYDGDVWDLYTGAGEIAGSLPVGVVMTLPATGSEGSNGSVITNEATKEKRDVMNEILRPYFVLMNPELTYSLPPGQTAYGIVDMFSHVTERYFSNAKDTLLTDEMCEGVMRGIVQNALKVIDDPTDYDARADLMWASIVAHNGLLGVGRDQDWACHTIGAQLSGVYGAVHGATLAILLPVWARYVYECNIARFAQFANRVFGVKTDFYHPERTAKEGIFAMENFIGRLGLPSRLSQIGITEEETFPAMAKAAVGGGTIGCIKALDESDVLTILGRSK